MTVQQRIQRLFFVFLLIAPVIWLVVSEEGQRQTDLLIMGMMGHPDVNLNLKALNITVTEQELAKALQNPEWNCRDQFTSFGERFCYLSIASFNGVPGRYMAVFFQSGQLTAMKVGYQASYQDKIRPFFTQQLGEPTAGEHDVISWENSDGKLLVPGSEESAGDDPALLWLAKLQAPATEEQQVDNSQQQSDGTEQERASQ